MEATFGEKISPVLVELEESIWEYELMQLGQHKFTEDGFRAILKICMAALMDKMWDLQKRENIEQPERKKMATELGGEFRKMVKTYTDIDTHELYKK